MQLHKSYDCGVVQLVKSSQNFYCQIVQIKKKNCKKTSNSFSSNQIPEKDPESKLNPQQL